MLLVGGCMASPPPPVQPSAPPPVQAEYPTEKTIYVATDSIGAGFNPHVASDQSPVTTAVGTLTLPSAFDPVPTPDGGLEWRLSEALLTSAEVTSTAPFKVTYKIQTNAQWSDGLPITGDDFAYLWQQMSRQPNAVAPAGYRLIDAVQTGSGGKSVVVTFAREYPQWRELFRSLLPSHILRALPNGFQTGMDSGKPVSGGPFAIVGIDLARDEVRLVRNDRFWQEPADLDQIVFRRPGTQSQTVQSVRTGDSALGVVSAGPAQEQLLSSIPGSVSRRNLEARVLDVHVNSRSSSMRQQPVRAAILGMINADLVRYAAAGDDDVAPFSNTVYSPSDPGYYNPGRARPSVDSIDALLASAGYRRGEPVQRPAPSPDPEAPSPSPSAPPSTSPAPVKPRPPVPGKPRVPGPSPSSSMPPSTPTAKTESRDKQIPVGVAPVLKGDQQLQVRIGAVATDPRTVAAAAAIADQLRASGVLATVVKLSNSELYGSALTGSRVDLIVGWSDAGVAPATALASLVDCDQPKKGTDSGDSGQLKATYTSNISGLCDVPLIDIARQALAAPDPSGLLYQAEGLLADASIYLPIYQDSSLVVVTDEVTGVPLTGPVQTSIFADAPRWAQR
ncbi:ABC transporter family substrate-binding protein [Gordonia sp. (in: high G+C Gram-positive bacteria)]|uniref:ABC transporter family substrate-binding protein n=1 Tax=Gordonia sp. (in: high G+C Gram-positive bacteria) TaxID=84139 RepID=UPI0039E24956